MIYGEKKSLIKVGMADDHVLLRNALASLIDSFGDCRVIHQTGTGKKLIENIMEGEIPDVVLLDLNMPDMNGFETAIWLQKNYPDLPVLMLTMYDSTELKTIGMITVTVTNPRNSEKNAVDF